MSKLEIRLLECMAKKNKRIVTELAKESGVNVNVLYGLLNGHKRSLRTDTLIKLCDALDCEVHELLVLKRGDE